MSGADGDAGYDDSMDDSAGDNSGNGQDQSDTDVTSQVDSFSEFSSGNFSNANFGGAPQETNLAFGSQKTKGTKGETMGMSLEALSGKPPGIVDSIVGAAVDLVSPSSYATPGIYDSFAADYQQQQSYDVAGGDNGMPGGDEGEDYTPSYLKPRKAPSAKVAATTSSNKASLNIPTRKQIRRAAIRYI